MIKTFDELRSKVYENVLNVYDIFKNFFGEESVDLQGLASDEELLPSDVSLSDFETKGISTRRIAGIQRVISQRRTSDRRYIYPYILVYWPMVTVTNENNKSTLIHELYAKVYVDLEGQIPFEYTFQLNRSRYSFLEFTYSYSGYMHSHISSIPKDNFSEFQSPCLGRGPINHTISTLRTAPSPEIWMLFCQELALYVTVESLSGGPYHRLEEIGARERDYRFRDFTPIHDDFKNICLRKFGLIGIDDINEFIEYYIKNGHFSVCYSDGHYGIGMSYFDYMMDLSNCFIEFFNKKGYNINARRMYDEEALCKVTISFNTFCRVKASERRDTNIDHYRGAYVCTFKGKEIRLEIDPEIETQQQEFATILNHDFAMHLMHRILRIINYKYKNEYNAGKSGTVEKLTSTYKEVQYV